MNGPGPQAQLDTRFRSLAPYLSTCPIEQLLLLVTSSHCKSIQPYHTIPYQAPPPALAFAVAAHVRVRMRPYEMTWSQHEVCS